MVAKNGFVSFRPGYAYTLSYFNRRFLIFVQFHNEVRKLLRFRPVMSKVVAGNKSLFSVSNPFFYPTMYVFPLIFGFLSTVVIEAKIAS